MDTMSATIMKRYNPGLTDPQLRQLVAAHIDDDSFSRYVIQQDINGIALELREAVGGRKKVAERDCAEVGLAEKPKTAAVEKVKG